MTQKALGERIGVSSNTIHLWETRITRPNIIYLYQLSQVMDKPLSNLIEDASLVWEDRIKNRNPKRGPEGSERTEGKKMIKEPVLVIMAAGMGSRYGGLKQIDPIDDQGHIIMDFSIFDAVRAGFKKVVFIIKPENEQIFKETIGDRMEKYVQVRYAFQTLDKLPDGFAIPEGRVKPWGTGHAVLSAKDEIDGPFAVINADDYYGPNGFDLLYKWLTSHTDDERYRYVCVGYRLGNTLTENGHVSRGVCEVDDRHYLQRITERTYIVTTPEGAAYSEDDGKTLIPISAESTVSMNMWGFTEGFLKELEGRFAAFLKNEMPCNPLKSEYFLPSVVSQLLAEGKATAQVLKTPDKWFGVTYKEDKPDVVKAFAALKAAGVYPEKLWEDR